MSLFEEKTDTLYEEARSAIKDYLIKESLKDKRLKELDERKDKLVVSLEKKTEDFNKMVEKILNKEGINIYISNKSQSALNLINSTLTKYRDTAPDDFEEFKEFCYSSNELIKKNLDNYVSADKSNPLLVDFITPSDFNRRLQIIGFKDLRFEYTLFGEKILSISNSFSNFSDSCKVEPSYAIKELDRLSFNSVENGERIIETYEKIDENISERIKNPEALEKELVSSFYVCLERLNNISEKDLLPEKYFRTRKD